MAEKGIINYSVAGVMAAMGKNAGKMLYAPRLQVKQTISLAAMAQHMSEHDSKYNEGDIYAVLVQFIKCIKEMAADGKKVQLGDLGAFSPKIKAVSQTTADDVSAQDITRVTLRWAPGIRTKNFRDDCDFQQVATRKNQALLLQAEKNGQTSMSLAEKSTQGSGNGSGGTEAGGE